MSSSRHGKEGGGEGPSFMDLCLAAERHFRRGNTERAVTYYHAASRVGAAAVSAAAARGPGGEDGEDTDTDAATPTLAHIGAVHSQLGVCFAALGEHDKSLLHHKKDLHIARKVGDRTAECAALGNVAGVHRAQGNIDKAVDYLQKSLKIAQALEHDNEALVASVLDSLGNLFHAMGNDCAVVRKPVAGGAPRSEAVGKDAFNRAIKYYRHAYEKKQLKTDDRAGLGRACGNLGTTFEQLREFDKAVEYHMRRRDLAQEIGDRAGEGRACCNVGNAYRAMGKLHKATEFYLLDRQIAEELQDQSAQAIAHSNLAHVYQALGDSTRAIEHYEQHLGLVNLLGNQVGLSIAYGNLGALFESVHDHNKAIDCFTKQVGVARGMNDRVSEAEAYKSLTRANEARERAATSGEESSEGEGNAWMKSAPAALRRATLTGASHVAKRLSLRVAKPKRRGDVAGMFGPEDVELGRIESDAVVISGLDFARSASDPQARAATPSSSDANLLHPSASPGTSRSPMIARRLTASKETIQRSIRRVSMLFRSKTAAGEVRPGRPRSPPCDMQQTELGVGAVSLSDAVVSFQPQGSSTTDGGTAGGSASSALSRLTAKSSAADGGPGPGLTVPGQESGARRIQVKPSPNADRRLSVDLSEASPDGVAAAAPPADTTVRLRSKPDPGQPEKRKSQNRLSQEFTAVVIEPSSGIEDEGPGQARSADTAGTTPYVSTEEEYTALYAYAKNDDDEVSFEAGDDVSDVLKIDDGWYHGTVTRTGQRGLIPANYLQPKPGTHGPVVQLGSTSSVQETQFV